MLALGFIGPAPSARAAGCPPASVGGKAVGFIAVDDVRVPIKRVRQASNGSLDSVPSAKVASVVTDWQPLSSASGTSVILWHSRFGVGCNGTLNTLMQKRPGATFTVTDGRGDAKEYVISAVHVVKKGRYWDDWFRWDGPRQLTLVTCTGLKDGVFTQNHVITAIPV